MKSSYKSIGKYIRVVDIRNTEDKKDNLLGVSVSKVFIKSIANTVGTDFTLYRVVKKNQFTYIPDTSRRGDKIGIALLENEEEGLVSQAYTAFEITDKESLLPEYLMMWFRRPEFDRYARFISHGSVREIFSWEDMCNVSLPIPPITKQREIVKEYKTVVNRIKLNQELIQKLEETAQAIYKQWFVDFEFPDENGMPYKSNGGEMEESELGEIPKGWKVESIKDFCKEMKSGGTPSRDNPEFWNSNDVPWLKTGELGNGIIIESEEYISNEGCKNSSAKKLPINTVLIAMYGEGKTKGQVGFLKFEASTNQACCAMICDNIKKSTFLYYYLQTNRDQIANMANGGAQPNLSKALIEELVILKPIDCVLKQHPFEEIINLRESITREIFGLNKIMDLLLSKLATIKN